MYVSIRKKISNLTKEIFYKSKYVRFKSIRIQTLFIVIGLVNYSCKNNNETLFTEIPTNQSEVHFTNSLVETEEWGYINYYYFYNGGGVAIGDVNNDGLYDIYFTGNMVSNKLYLNKGGLKFEDITEKAHVACKNVWST